MLPAAFVYSQASLQDFVDCRRRFQLRYVQRLAWPAQPGDPALDAEKRMIAGQRFHRLVQQYLHGLLPAGFRPRGELGQWWQAYLDFIARPQVRPYFEAGAERRVECRLSASLAGRRVSAVLDCLALRDGRALIFDWKTGRPPADPAALEARLQTRVYRYVLVKAGEQVTGRPLDPQAVALVYWFASPPGYVRLAYSREKHQEDEAYLAGLVTTIEGLGPDDFPRAGDPAASRYCLYRSLCPPR